MKHIYAALLRWKHTGELAADGVASSPVVTFGGEEGYQVHRITLDPPVTDEGALENMMAQLHCDGKAMDIRLDSRMAGPFKEKSYTFSLELGDRLSTNPFENPCPKGRRSISIEALGGLGGVTADFEVIVWGDYFYMDAAVKKFFRVASYGKPCGVVDEIRDKRLYLDRAIPCSIENLPYFPGGGVLAGEKYTRPFITFGRNALATTPNQPYEMGTENNHVTRDWESLVFDLAKDEGMIVHHVGAVPHDNSKELWLELPEDYEYPRGRWPFELYDNHVPIGCPLSDYQGPRKLEQPLIATGEKLSTFIRDNGTAIPVNGILAAIWATYVKM